MSPEIDNDRSMRGGTMHIALFSPGWPLDRFHNGIVTFVHWMRVELQRLGHRVSVFVPKDACLEQGPGIHPVSTSWSHRFRRRLPHQLGGVDDDIWSWGKVVASTILDVHRRDPIDVIEMEESFGWFRDVELHTRIPVLVKLHGPAFLSLVEHELTSPLGLERVVREGEALRSARAIAAPARDTLRRTLDHYGLTPAIEAHIPNPVQIDASLPMWRRDLGRKRVLFVGRFDKRKGADVVLQAFGRLWSEDSSLSLTFVGPDRGLLQADGSQVHFDEFCRTSLGTQVRASIDFRGHQSPSEIAALRATAAAVVVASRWENQGYALIEAMQQGCPVVASDVGGNPESVVHGETGLLFASGQPGQLADRLKSILRDGQLADALGAGARGYVLARHAAPNVARDSLVLYQQICGR